MLFWNKEKLPILDIEAIRDNPWNAVVYALPENPSPLLLGLAYQAADYCCKREGTLTNAARAGLYMPPGWEPGEGQPDVHEFNEQRWCDADWRCDDLEKLALRAYLRPAR